MDRKHEVAMVALLLEELSMTKSIDAAEWRLMQRYLNYNSGNPYWVKDDDMLKDQDKLMVKIRSFSESIMNQQPSVSHVSDFLNNPSTSKKRKATVMDGLHSDDGGDDLLIIAQLL